MQFNQVLITNGFIRTHYRIENNQVIFIDDRDFKQVCFYDQTIYNDKVSLDYIRKVLND